MVILLKLFLVLILCMIFYQDYRDRMVLWLFYPLVSVFGFCIQLFYYSWQSIIAQSLINLIFILLLICISFLFSKLVIKKKFLNESIGIGDVLLFFGITVLFPIITFCVLFVVSLIFSLIMHLVLTNKKEKKATIPLAGYMSLFYGVIYIASIFTTKNILFTL